VINLNALLRRRVEYYEYPWAIEGRLRSAQSRLRSLFQASDVVFIFSKSMPRSGHRFLTECLTHYFGPELHYCGFYRPGCCHRIPCAHPHGDGKANRYFMQKSHDFGFRDSSSLNGKYLIQYRSPIPRLQSNYDLALSRGTVGQSKEAFASFAHETVYFINFYRKWVAEPLPNALAVAYEDLIGEQARTARRRGELHRPRQAGRVLGRRRRQCGHSAGRRRGRRCRCQSIRYRSRGRWRRRR
jgi:hypothetical protein